MTRDLFAPLRFDNAIGGVEDQRTVLRCDREGEGSAIVRRRRRLGRDSPREPAPVSLGVTHESGWETHHHPSQSRLRDFDEQPAALALKK